MTKIDDYLKLMVDSDASDLFLSTGSPPYLKINGATKMLDAPKFAPGEVQSLAYGIMNERQRAQFELTLESNFAFTVENVGRFRVNAYRQRGEVSLAMRHIRLLIRNFEQLGLPPESAELSMLKRGLVLLVGAAGSGKSTSIAAMIDYRARNADNHILTIEDPIEFLFPQRRSLVDQREVGVDTLSFGDALRNAMRESPDVIMIGEIRDMETAQHAIAYAEAGQLCIATMHSNNANQAIDRIINFFPVAAHKQLLMDLSLNIEGVISHRLVSGIKGSRVLAVEVLRHSAYIAEMIREGRLDQIKPEMQKGNQAGVKTFDQSLFELYKAGRISREETLLNADSRVDLDLKIRLYGKDPAAGAKTQKPI
ncbi:MAG: PilT/PilU family type 4a pilus ATPase [Burkholderiales bacterium]